MAIDFSPLSRIKSVGDFDQERQARQMNALQLLGAQQKADEYSRSVADANALRQIQQELAGTAPEQMGQALRARGRWDMGIKADKDYAGLQGQRIDNTAKQVNIEKDQLAMARDRMNFVGNVIAGAKDPVSYAQGLQTLKANGIDTSNLPQQFDPVYVRNSGDQVRTEQDRLAEIWKQKGYDLDLRKQGEVERQNQTQNKISQGNLGVAQANLGLRRAEMDRAKTESTKAPAGYRWKADGTLEAIPGGPATVKPGGSEAKKVDAQDVLMLVKEAKDILPSATGSYAGAAVDQGARLFGISTDGAKASAKLKTISGLLISKQPKMSGPQSDADVKLYREMAGQVGDETLPIETRLAALDQIEKINHVYAGNVAAPENPKPTPTPTGKPSVTNW